MSFHPEALTPELEAVLRRVGPVATRGGFYLGGGTAVAIHLGHRRSLDLDWFSPEAFRDPLGLARGLREERGLAFETMAVEPGTLRGLVSGVRVSFLEYRYPTLSPPERWPDLDVRVASLDDLATMKLAAIAQRGARKDFVDLYALVREHGSLAKLLDLYQKRYEIRDPGHVLYALSYFDEAEQAPMPKMLWEEEWPEIRAAVERWVRDLADRG